MVDKIHKKIVSSNKKYTSIYGIPRGGLVLAVLLSHKLNIPIISNTYDICESTLIVDDILDSGNTIVDFKEDHDHDDSNDLAVLVVNEKSCISPDYCAMENKQEVWIKFPWEVHIIDEVSKVKCEMDKDYCDDSHAVDCMEFINTNGPPIPADEEVTYTAFTDSTAETKYL